MLFFFGQAKKKKKRSVHILNLPRTFVSINEEAGINLQISSKDVQFTGFEGQTLCDHKMSL